MKSPEEGTDVNFDSNSITSAINRFCLSLNFLLELNYQIVELFVEFFASLIHFFVFFAQFWVQLFQDLIDQYAAFCLAFFAIFSTSIDLFYDTIDKLSDIITIVVDHFVAVTEKLLSSITKFDLLIENNLMCDFLSFKIFRIPCHIVEAVYDGFSMVISSLYHYTLSISYFLFGLSADILARFCDFVAFSILLFIKICVTIIWIPFYGLACIFKRAPIPAMILILILVLLILCFKYGIFSRLLHYYCRTVRRFILLIIRYAKKTVYKLRNFLLPMAEYVITCIVPQATILFRIFRLLRSPILYFYNIFARLVFGGTIDEDVDHSIVGNDTPNDSDRLLCIVCQEREKTVMLQPCCHLCLCRRCSNNLSLANSPCPVCRAEVTDRVFVYL